MIGSLVLAPIAAGSATVAELSLFLKDPVTYCLANPAGCTIATEAVVCTAVDGCPTNSVVQASSAAVRKSVINATKTELDDIVTAAKRQKGFGVANANDLNSIRTHYGLTDANTIAVGKTDIPSLEGQTFEGLSPALRRQAGLESLDELYGVSRPIKSPNPNPIASRHAEEDIFNGLAHQIDAAGLSATQLNGRTVNIHISNSGGVCNTCYQGLGSSNATAGVIKQFSERYPTLSIRITAEGGTVRQGVDAIIVRGGKIVD